jgi:hypothetical protein
MDDAPTPMLDEFAALVAQLHLLTAALHTAILADDVPTFTQIVQGRTPLLWRAIHLWEAAPAEIRAQMEPQMRAIMATNALAIAAGDAWLHAARRRLVALHQGRAALDRYRAPLTHLHA